MNARNTRLGEDTGARAEVEGRPRLLIHSEAFCPLSETFVYRTAAGITSFATTVLTYERLNATEFPDAHLSIRVLNKRHAGRLRRGLAILENGIRWGVPSAEAIVDETGEGVLVPKADVMFAHFATCGFRLLPVALARGVPLVTMFHGCDIGSWLGFPRYRRCLDTLFRRGTAFIVASEFMRDRAVGLGCPPRKIHKIPYSVPELPEIDGRCCRLGSPVRFLHVGRLHEQKGILHTLRAFEIVAKRLPDAELVVVGDGPERAMAEKFVGVVGLGARVAFRGAVPFSQVRTELARADIYVIHSVTTAAGDTEGFGVSLAEASQARLPIVATCHNGFPEVVLDGTTGLLVPERDVRAMADAMLTLASDPSLRSRMGAAGRAHVRDVFAPEKVIAQHVALFNSLIAT